MNSVQMSRTSMLGEQKKPQQPLLKNDQPKTSKLQQQYAQFLDNNFQTDKMISHQMYKSLKYVFLFLLYLSYGFLIAAVVLIWINAQTQRQQFIDYINTEGRIQLLIALIFLGLLIAMTYKCYSTNADLTAPQRKFTNFFLDCLKLAFHICFLFYVLGFVDSSKQQMIKIAFILFSISLIAFAAKFIIKWVHFYIGTGRGEQICSEVWGSLFQPNREERQKHLLKIKELKETLQQFLKKNQAQPQ